MPQLISMLLQMFGGAALAHVMGRGVGGKFPFGQAVRRAMTGGSFGSSMLQNAVYTAPFLLGGLGGGGEKAPVDGGMDPNGQPLERPYFGAADPRQMKLLEQALAGQGGRSMLL